jgi:uncharacterized integral membrane protein
MSIKLPDETVIRKRVEQYFEDRNGLLIHAFVFAAINLLLWAIWFFTGTWAWPLIISLAWGSGLAAHAIDVLAKAPRRLAALDRGVFRQMEDLYGPDWREMADPGDYQRLHQAAHQAHNQRKELVIHGIVYVMINLAAWFIWGMVTRGAGFPIPFILSGAWGLGLAAHGVTIYAGSSRARARREYAVQEAVERERAYLYGDASHKEKRKHERLMLTEDGELLHIVDMNDQSEARQRDHHETS